MKNELLEEIWRNRDAFAREHGYSIDAMVAALKELERQSSHPVVDRRKAPPDKPARSAQSEQSRADRST